MSSLGSNTFKNAYLGKHANALLMKTSEQVIEVYHDCGLIIPVVVSSTLQCIKDNPGISLVEIGRKLGLQHQLVAQRIAKLDSLNLIMRRPDPTDKRRSGYYLTDKGHDQAVLLEQCMADTALVYGDLYAEIGVDLPTALLAFIAAIEAKPLKQRFSEKFSKTYKEAENV